MNAIGRVGRCSGLREFVSIACPICGFTRTFPGRGLCLRCSCGRKGGPMLCEEIMKDDVQCLSARSTAEEAARAITDRDIAVRLVAAKKPGTTTVEQLMSRQIISRSPKDDIGLAQELMAANHKSRIVCVNDAGRLVGVISLSDIAQHDPRC